MRLNPQQLRSQLRSKGVGPLYLVSGDEPLLVDETVDLLRRAARDAGCAERNLFVAERGFDWESFRASLDNLSLFASQQLIELRLPTGKPGDKGSRELVAVASSPPADKVILIITPGLSGNAAKAKWVRALTDAGAWVPLRAPAPEQLPAWLAARLKTAGLSCDPDALELLAARVEGNLLAAKQEIDKLVLLAPSGRVTPETVRAAVADGARFDVFQLADAALAGDLARTARVAQQLQREGVAAPLALWGLVREITALADVRHRLDQGEAPGKAMTAAGVWRSREGLLRRAVERFDGDRVRQLLAAAQRTDRIVKGARPGVDWNALLELALSLAAPAPAAGRP
ncbi:MAG: DNA polymerase III subunit delta [Gammaproteobacteria bacterium]|nr:DNA polymerase III subunit delta [Gammaproteobacteria bacterium]